MGCSSSVTAPVWVRSAGCSPSGTVCSSVGPPRGHKPCQQTCSGMGCSPQVLPGTCSSAGSPWGHSLLWASTCSGMGPSLRCRWVSALLWASMDCRGTACLTMGCSMGCRRTSAPVPGAPPPPPSSLTLVSAELSHLTPLSYCSCHCAGFFPFLTMLSQRRYHHC